MKSFKNIALAFMILYSFNDLSADITLVKSKFKYVNVDSIKDVIEKITEKENDFIALGIHNYNIKFEDAKNLVSALKEQDCKLTTLTINNSNIGNILAGFIGKALIDPNCKLTSLNLLNSNIEYDINNGFFIPNVGAKNILEALVDPNCKLTRLDLSGNKIKIHEIDPLILKNKNCKLILLNLRDNRSIWDDHQRKINLTKALCTVNNLKRMLENDEINQNNYEEIINGSIDTLSYVQVLNKETVTDWYNSLKKEKLPYLDSEYKEELIYNKIENSDEAIKYIQNKFTKLKNELEKEYKNVNDFLNNEELMDILSVQMLLREDFGQGDFGVEV